MPTSPNATPAEPVITIKVDGKPALTVEMAAARYGLTLGSMSAAITRLGDSIRPAAPLDGRKQLYYVAALDKAMKGRPGKGANLRGHG